MPFERRGVCKSTGSDACARQGRARAICSIKTILAASAAVSRPKLFLADQIRTAPAVYEIGADAYVALQGAGAHCPSGASETGLTVLKIRAGERPAFKHGVVRPSPRCRISDCDNQRRTR